MANQDSNIKSIEDLRNFRKVIVDAVDEIKEVIQSVHDKNNYIREFWNDDNYEKFTENLNEKLDIINPFINQFDKDNDEGGRSIKFLNNIIEAEETKIEMKQNNK